MSLGIVQLPKRPEDPVVLAEPRIDPESFVAPDAKIYGEVIIEARVVIMFGVVIRAELDQVRIGERSNIQDNTIIHCDPGFPCIVGENTTVGHAAVLHSVRVGAHALVGIGAMALTGSELGEGAWLAAGSVLTEGRTVPPWTLAMGTPAKPVRDLTDAEIERQRSGVEMYQRFLETYRPLFP